MTTTGWRNLAVILAAICAYQLWRGCTRSTPAPAPQAAAPTRLADCLATVAANPSSPSRADATRPTLPARDQQATSLYGFKVPPWVMHLAPQPGEKLRDYRDRILPLAELAIAPHRARVVRNRDDFAALQPRQRAELDAAVHDAATAIQDRVMNGIASGELRPGTFKPMTGVTLARDVLDIVERGNARFMNALSPDERARLASHRFDFADYLLFSAHWEDALHVLD